MSAINNIILDTSEEELENLLSPFIEEQFPSFMREDYRKLVLFIKAYYEWLEKSGNPGYVLSKMDTVFDLDCNAEEFYEYFKQTFLATFPDMLATNPSGNKPNKKTLLKKIRDFYGNKGTESAYKFLFRVLYDSDLELYYPKTDILRASDGQWTEPKSIKTTSKNGSVLFSGKNGQIVQYSGQEIVSSAFINGVVQYSFNGFPITEFFITDISGQPFVPDRPVRILKDENSWEETAYSVLGQFYFETPGSNYRVGDLVTVVDPSGNGVGFSAKIDQVGLAGGIKRIGISNSGINYGTDLIVNIFSDTGQQTAKVFAVRSAITNYPGYFSGNRGKVSSNKKVQDGNYYQEFSYELKSEVAFDVYFDVLRRIIHPAGMRMFGSVLVKKSLDNTLSSSSQAAYYEVPLVGRYTPYTVRTFNDLRDGLFLPNQVRGATLQVWLSAYNITGITTDGVTVGWQNMVNDATIGSDPGGTPATTEDILGINRWQSLVTGYTFSQNNAYPNSSVWLTPELKPYSLNTHTTVNIRPLQYNFSGPSYLGAAVSHGFFGPSGGRMGLTASKSYFAVVKPNRISSIGTVNSTSARVILGDTGSYHGIVFGLSGTDLTDPKVFAFTNSVANGIIGVCGSIGSTGEWKLLSHTHSVGGGNSGPFSLFLDGVCLGTQSQAWVPESDLSNADITVGVRRIDSLNGVFDGEIAEVVMYQGDVGTVDRQKIEGYLAHKYGLDGNLPSDHPYKTTAPGASFGGGKWYGTTGDFYHAGYNPYIGSTAQVGPDGTTAPRGSLFYDSGLGYSLTVADEFGITAHNPIGAPLGSTAAWFRNAESNFTPSMMRDLVLWLKPENIVATSTTNGASMTAWTDSSPQANHAKVPTWDKWNGLVSVWSPLAGAAWSRGAFTNTPITKMSWKFKGVCGGFTTGRLTIAGLHTSSANASTAQPFSFYSYGPFGSGSSLLTPRVVYVRRVPSGGGGQNLFALSPDPTDESVYTVEYADPMVNYYQNGILKYQFRAGSGLTFYGNIELYSGAGTSVTVTELMNGSQISGATFTVFGSGVSLVDYRGITIDKLLPQMVTASYSSAGVTGVCFNGGVLYSPLSTTSEGASLNNVLSMGISYGNGSNPDKALTARHFYLSRPLQLNADMDAFVVFRPTIEGASYGIGMVSTARPPYNEPTNDSVFFHRSYNSVDRTQSLQNDENYVETPGGKFLYPSGTPTGLVGFRPQGDKQTSQQGLVAYDPHLSGVCLGFCVGEWTRDTDGRIQTYLNGDSSTNSSLSTGRRVATTNPLVYDDSRISNGLVFAVDPKNSNTELLRLQRSKDLTRAYTRSWKPTPQNFIGKYLSWKSNPALGIVTSSIDSAVIGSASGDVVVSTDVTSGLSAAFWLGGRYSYGGNPTYLLSPVAGTNTVFLRVEDGAVNPANAQSRQWNLTFYIRKWRGHSGTAASFSASEFPTVFVDSKNPTAGQIAVGPASVTEVDTTNRWYRMQYSVGGGGSAIQNPIVVAVGISNLDPNEQYLVSAIQLTTTYSDVVGPNEPVQTDVYTLSEAAFKEVDSSYYYAPQANGQITEWGMIYETDPWGRYSVVMQGNDRDERNYFDANGIARDNYDGGWATSTYGFYYPAIDPTKLYRFSVWVKTIESGNAAFYLGLYSANGSVNNGVIVKSSGTSTTNYYSIASSGNSYANDSTAGWKLFVFHAHPTGTAIGSNHPYSGVYLANGGGTTVASAPVGDVIWNANTTSAVMRSFLIGGSDRKQNTLWFQPRIDEITDGNEGFPSVTELLENAPDRIDGNSPNGVDLYMINHTDVSTDYGGVMVFDGRTDRAQSSQAVTVERNFTWEAWAYCDDPINPFNMFMGHFLPYFGFYAGNKIIFTNSVGGLLVSMQSFTNVVPLRWYHLSFTVKYNQDTNTTDMSVYINGKLDRTETYSGAQDNPNRPLTIGDGIESFTGWGAQRRMWYPFKGKVGPVRLYNRTLSAAEIKQNYDAVKERYDEIG